MNGRCGTGEDSSYGRVNNNSPRVGGGATGGPANGPRVDDSRLLFGVIPVIKSTLPR